MVIMVIMMTHAPKIGNALYDARLQENYLLTQRATWQARSRMGDDVGSVKRPKVIDKHRERTETSIVDNLFLRGAAISIIISLGAVLWLLI
jgi:hypothetical protein